MREREPRAGQASVWKSVGSPKDGRLINWPSGGMQDISHDNGKRALVENISPCRGGRRLADLVPSASCAGTRLDLAYLTVRALDQPGMRFPRLLVHGVRVEDAAWHAACRRLSVVMRCDAM